MKRKQYASTHEEALDRMCYVCGELIPDKMLRHDVVENLDKIGIALKCTGLAFIPNVTPPQFCHNCHLRLEKVIKGLTVKTDRRFQNWEVCGPACGTCLKITERKCGGRKKKVSTFLKHV